jgi:hypothetical protein
LRILYRRVTFDQLQDITPLIVIFVAADYHAIRQKPQFTMSQSTLMIEQLKQ